ncbi:MAG: transmembrane 220 family protein [Saprospiraceae bacterium]|nr:transmembrane 220 family protein [Saprospiraceae bacterium]
MKWTNLFLTALFALFALFQLNDPDPWGWVALYGYTALVTGMAAFGKYVKWLLIPGVLVTILWLAALFPAVIDWISRGMPSITGSMKAETPHIELTREFLGVLVCAIVLLMHFIHSRR